MSLSEEPGPHWAIRRLRAADGTGLAVHVAGDGPPLLCVPGGPGRASAYLGDLGGLWRERTLWRLDLRGTGLSELPEDRESLAFPRLADDVEAVASECGTGPVDVLAHSAGCHVALVHAARYPDAVRKLVLVTPSANGLADRADIVADVARIRAGRSDEPWYAEAAEIEAAVATLPEERQRRIDRGLRPFFYARWDTAAQEHAASTDTQMSLRATAAFRPENGTPLDLVALLAGVIAPTLVIVGGRDGGTGSAAGQVVADHLPNATTEVVEIADSAHYPWLDDPVEFAAVVQGWLSA